jgi:hypothetical protein
VFSRNCPRFFIYFFPILFLVGENFHFYFRCGSMSNCSVPVSSAVFEDPCPGTHKYVEVHYKCMLGWSSSYDKSVDANCVMSPCSACFNAKLIVAF